MTTESEREELCPMAPNIRPYHVLAASIPTIAAFFLTILYFRKKKILRGSIKFTDSSIASTATATNSGTVKEAEENCSAASTTPFVISDSQEKYSSEVADAIIKAVRDLETAAPITEIINEFEDETIALTADLLSPTITDHKLSSSNNINSNNNNNNNCKNLSTTALFFCDSDAAEMNEKLEFTVEVLDTSTQLITEDGSHNNDDINLSSLDYRRSNDVEEATVGKKHYEFVTNENILPVVVNDYSSSTGNEIVDSLTIAVDNCSSIDYVQEENCQKIMVDDKCRMLASNNSSDNPSVTNVECSIASNYSDNPNQYGNFIESGNKVNKLENADTKVKSPNAKKSTTENRKVEEEAGKPDLKNNTDKGVTNKSEISSATGEKKNDKVLTNKNELSPNTKKTDSKSNPDKTSSTSKLLTNKAETSAFTERRNDAKSTNTDKTPTKKNDIKKNNISSSNSSSSSSNNNNNGYVNNSNSNSGSSSSSSSSNSNSSSGSKIKSKVNESHTTKTDHIDVVGNEDQKTDIAEVSVHHDKITSRKSDNRIPDDNTKRPENGNKKRNQIKDYAGKNCNVEDVGYSNNNDSGRTGAAANKPNSHQNSSRQCNSDFYSSTTTAAGNRKTPAIFSKKYSSQKPRSSNDSNKKLSPAVTAADGSEEPKVESNSPSQQTPLINGSEEKSQTEDQKTAASNKQSKTNVKKKTSSDEDKEELPVGPVDGILEEGQSGVNSQHLFDARSEGSSDSGKGRSEGATTPTVHSPPGGSSVSGDNSIMTVYQFVIPQKYVGKLIGRKGQFINHIKETANTYVYIKKHPFSATKKVCAIEGTQQDINTALELIRARFPENQYEDLTLEEFPMIPIAEPATLQSDYCQALELVEGVNNDVIVSSLISAGHMFLQQPMHPTYQQLITLNFLMNETYSRTQTPAVINPSVDTIVAAPAVDGWYRAQIVSVNDEEEICDIRFLDYGGYLSLSFSALRAIRYDFLNLPFQAVECYLANIAPIDGVWSDEAKLMVETLTYGQVLRAQVYDYAENGAPLILLYSLIGSQVIMINQELVARGYAYDIVNIPSADAVSAAATQNEPAASIKQTTPQTSASVAAV